jgi:hypothetical protein
MINDDIVRQATYSDHSFLPLPEWLRLESGGCDGVLAWLSDEVVSVANHLGQLSQNLTQTVSLFYLLRDSSLPTNHYHWMLAKTVSEASEHIMKHLIQSTSVMIASPDCISLSLRKIFAS